MPANTIMEIFEGDAFDTTELTSAITDIPYIPGLLGEMSLFEPMPITGYDFAIEKKAETIGLIDTSAIGAAPKQIERNLRDMRKLNTVRLAEAFTIYSYELSGVRAFGETTVLDQIQDDYARRVQKLMNRLELTRENHRLGAIQGKLLDANGTSVIYDYFEEFELAEPAVINFKLNVPDTEIRAICNETTRSIVRGSMGAIGSNSQICALAGDEFFDKLVDHANVKRTYDNWSAAAELRKNMAFEAFPYGGIMWYNYRGTDDNSQVAVPSDEAIIFPKGGNDVFKEVMSPAEFGPWVNTPGQSEYMLNIVDKDRQAWTKGELYSYPLFLCQRPQVLRRAVISA